MSNNWDLSGSKVNLQVLHLTVSHVEVLEPKNEFYNPRNFNVPSNGEEAFRENLLEYVNLCTSFKKQEIEQDIKLWFKVQLDTLLQLQEPEEYEVYKKALREELEWNEVMYSDLSVIKILKATIDCL